ncbi:MAG: App1 family protein [Longimicrobiales bacterium]
MFDDVSGFARSIGHGLGSLKRDLDRRIGRTDRPQVVAYRGYGNEQNAWISGRVLRDPGLTRAVRGDAWWRNLLNTYKRIESDEIPGAHVRVHGFGRSTDMKSDQEGFFRLTVPVRTRNSEELWHPIEFELVAPLGADGRPSRSVGHVLMPGPKAEYGVISDLDDTVVRTDVQSVPRMIRAIALGNAHTRLPFPGVAAFYRALQLGRAGQALNPVFYVSSSPWNLYDLLDEFLAVRGIPAGPLILRDWGIGVNAARNAPHKLEAIAHILDAYPKLPFILIGDSGQQDPEIYSEVMARYPARIQAAYIRNVTPQPERSAAIKNLIRQVTESGSTMVLTDDTLAAARHAVERGWIADSALGAILADEAAENEQGPRPESEGGPQETVVIDSDYRSGTS